MANKYTITECGSCAGTGRRHDSTCADKVDAGPYANRCATCNGTGKTSRLTSSIERDARDAQELAARLAVQEIGEMPDWML